MDDALADGAERVAIDVACGEASGFSDVPELASVRDKARGEQE